jgi:hypothetical protein
VTGADRRGGDGTRNRSAHGFVSARGDDARRDNDRGKSETRATRMKWGSEHLKQFYNATFYRLWSAKWGSSRAMRGSPRVRVVHFFLDIELKAPYKGDTTALSGRVARILM